MPFFAMEMARLLLRKLFPTPPFPEVRAHICFFFPLLLFIYIYLYLFYAFALGGLVHCLRCIPLPLEFSGSCLPFTGKILAGKGKLKWEQEQYILLLLLLLCMLSERLLKKFCFLLRSLLCAFYFLFGRGRTNIKGNVLIPF